MQTPPPQSAGEQSVPEERDFLTMDEAAQEIGWNKATVYGRLPGLGIETRKFEGSRNAWLSREEVERIKQIKAQPWLAAPKARRSKKLAQQENEASL